MNDVDRSRDYDRDTFRSDDPDLEAYEYENEDGGVRLPLFLILALVVVAAIVGVWFIAYQQGLQDGRAEGTPPFIAGSDTAERAAPDNPGGLPAPQDSDVFGDLGSANEPETIVPREEQIVDLPAPPRRDIEQIPLPSRNNAGTSQPDLRGSGSTGALPPPPSTSTNTGFPPAPTQTANRLPAPTTTAPAPTTVQPSRGVTAVPPPSNSLRVPPPTQTTQNRVPAPSTSVPAPTTSTVGPRPAPAGAAGGNWVVQLASLESAGAADQAWTRLSGRMGDVLAGYRKDVQVANVNGTTYHRLRIGYFPSKSAANSLCQSLKGRGQDCYVTSR